MNEPVHDLFERLSPHLPSEFMKDSSLNLPIEFYTRDELDQVKTVPNPSSLVNKHIGVKSVCEAAAMLATGRTSLLIPKTAGRRVTLALAVISFKL